MQPRTIGGTEPMEHRTIDDVDYGRPTGIADFFQLTEIGQGGETFRRVPVVAGDIVMGRPGLRFAARCVRM